MSLSFSVSFTLFSALCSMCVLSNWQTDRCGDVSSFSLFLLPPFLIPSLSETPVKAAAEKQVRESENWGEAGSAKDGQGKFILLRQRTQMGELWAVEMRALRPSEMFCTVFLPPLTMWMALEMFSLFVAYSSISVSTSTALHKFLTVRLSLLSLKLLSYCCLRPKILLPWHTICTSHETNVCYSSKTIQWSKSILDKTSMF